MWIVVYAASLETLITFSLHVSYNETRVSYNETRVVHPERRGIFGPPILCRGPTSWKVDPQQVSSPSNNIFFFSFSHVVLAGPYATRWRRRRFYHAEKRLPRWIHRKFHLPFLTRFYHAEKILPRWIHSKLSSPFSYVTTLLSFLLKWSLLLKPINGERKGGMTEIKEIVFNSLKGFKPATYLPCFRYYIGGL